MSAMEATWWLTSSWSVLARRTRPTPHAVRPPQRHVGDGAGVLTSRVIRPHPKVVAFLQQRRDGVSWTSSHAEGGRKRGTPSGPSSTTTAALRRRDRHHERVERTPHHARAGDPRQHQELRAGRRRAAFEQGRQSMDEGQELLERFGPCDGERKAEQPADDRSDTDLHSGTGSIRSTAWSAATSSQAALLGEASTRAGHVLREKEDIFYLTFQELHDVLRTHQVDDELSSNVRRFRSYQAPRRPGCSRRWRGRRRAYRRRRPALGALIGVPFRRNREAGPRHS